MERQMSATQARINFGEVLRYVAEEQKPVIIERSGKPYAVILAIDAYEHLKAAQQQQPTLDAILRQARLARAQTREELAGQTLPDIVETIHQMREERDAELDNALGLRG
jgi:prevent-host-death family protein